MSQINDDTKHTVSRRQILGYATAGAGLSLLPWQWALAGAGEGAKAMRERTIPSSGKTLPVVGMGSSGSFETRDPEEIKALHQVMKQFVELGGKLVDTSPSYSNAETIIGQVAEEVGVREQLFMATKVRIEGKQAGIDQIASSAKTLGEPLDLVQIHNFIDLERQWKTLKQMRSEGKLPYIGITHYLVSAFEELERQMKDKNMDFVQFNYSIMTPDAEKRLLPLAADRGIAVLANRNFDDGQFFRKVKGKQLPEYAKEFDCNSWAQFALKYVLANEAVTAVIPATGDPKHLVDNMHAGYGALPDAAQRKRMRQTIADL